VSIYTRINDRNEMMTTSEWRARTGTHVTLVTDVYAGGRLAFHDRETYTIAPSFGADRYDRFPLTYRNVPVRVDVRLTAPGCTAAVATARGRTAKEPQL
jgi:hypothetical protein